MINIAIDAMGGDFGEKPIIEGVIEALKERPFNAILVGNPNILRPLIPKNLEQYIQYENANEVFSMNENATDALKEKKLRFIKPSNLSKMEKQKPLFQQDIVVQVCL